MLEGINSVLTRINDLQKRFSLKRNYIPHDNPPVKAGKSFQNILNENTGNNNNSGAISANFTVPRIKEIAREEALKNSMPPSLVNAVIQTESNYDPLAVSDKGAAGLMQLMPNVIKELGITDPFNVEENIKGGISILKKLMDKYGYDFKKALAAYNAGEGAVDKAGGIPPFKETRQYVKKVLDAYIENIK